MPEILLKVGTVGPDPAYQDQDPIIVITDRAIGCRHLDTLCHILAHPSRSDGRRIRGTLAERWQARQYRYRFERVSLTEVMRVDQITGAVDILSNTPNDKREAIDVATYIQNRLAHERHRIFGVPGAEVWYGGQIRRTDSIVSGMWTEIEGTTSLRRDNYRLFPWGELDLRSHLVLELDEATDDDADVISRSEYLGEEDNLRIVRRRAIWTQWRDAVAPQYHAAIARRDTRVDLRGVVGLELRRHLLQKRPIRGAVSR